MNPLSKHLKKYRVDYGDSDYFRKLKLSSLFNYLQDVASSNVYKLGLGVEYLQQDFGVTWVLVKILVEIHRIPELNEEITVETWPLEPKKLEFERDFLVRDLKGEILIRAISSWVIMDMEKREIRKSELLLGKFPEFISDRAIDQRMGKIKPNGQLKLVYKKVIGYSDIDINGHLNNSKYIDYITDCFSIVQHGKYAIDSIQVSYLSEALAGDTICFYKDISVLESGVVYVEGINETGEKPCFKACITIRQI